LAKVFWFTGQTEVGKTTLLKKLEHHLKNNTKIQVIYGVELQYKINTKLGMLSKWYFRLLKRKMRLCVLKNLVEQADRSSQSDVTVLVETNDAPKVNGYTKKQLNGRLILIHITCSKECRLKRLKKRKLPKNIFFYINNYLLIHKVPEFPDITIDTEHQSVEESFQTLLTLIDKNQLLSTVR